MKGGREEVEREGSNEDDILDRLYSNALADVCVCGCSSL